MKISIISNLGPREVPLKEGDTVEDVMASEELEGFQVILPVCKDRQLKDPLSQELSLQKQGLSDNSTIYCKFKLKEDTNDSTSSEPLAVSSKSPVSTKNKKGASKTANRKPKHNAAATEVLSPMHIRPTVVTRKRSKVSSVDKLLFSPPPPNKKGEVHQVASSIPKLSMRQSLGGLDDFMVGKQDVALSPLRIKPAIARRKRAKSDPLLFSPVAKATNDYSKKARLDFHPTPPSVLQLQEALDAEGN